MITFPGALPSVSESIALLRSHSVGSVSSSLIAGMLLLVSSSSSVLVLSVENSSRWCSTHLPICLLESVMTSPDFVFSRTVFVMVGLIAFLILSYML